jgi:endonuclease YncB( thermonuclease family)
VDEFHGKVVSNADGDTVTVLRGTEQVKVRLDGIDVFC